MTEVKENRKRQKPGDVHYVNNKEFTQALHEYAQEAQEALAAGEERPVMSRYLGDCVLKMAKRLSTTPRFRGYSYRDEMIQNGILGCVKYMYRFDGTRFNNGFAYVTQILFSHFIVTIKNEKKKYEMNLRMIQEAEASYLDHEEFTHVADDHARAIADQKLKEIETAKVDKGRGGFTLRTGYTKESRDAYQGGTPMEEFLDPDKNDED